MKKISIIFTLIFSMVIGLMNIKAEGFTFNDVANKTKFLYGEDYEITSTDSSITIFDEFSVPERKTVFNYKDGIISYAYEGTDKGELGYSIVTIDNDNIKYIVNAIGVLHGYTEAQIETWYSKVIENYDDYTLEKDGIEFTADTFTWGEMKPSKALIREAIPAGNEDAFTAFKIDINNIKIETIGNTDMIPEIKISGITDKSFIAETFVKTDDVMNTICEMYISTNDVDYKLFASGGCGVRGFQFNFTSLLPNTTYYVKSTIKGYNNFSKPVKVTTLAADSKKDQATQEIPNPDTSDINIVLVILTIIISSFVGYYAYRKKKMI